VEEGQANYGKALQMVAMDAIVQHCVLLHTVVVVEVDHISMVLLEQVVVVLVHLTEVVVHFMVGVPRMVVKDTKVEEVFLPKPVVAVVQDMQDMMVYVIAPKADKEVTDYLTQ
jgi:hypothetical protein